MMASVSDSSSDHGRTRSIWLENWTPPEFQPLREGIEADVCVIGSGIAGLTTAYLLSRDGRRVVVLDKTGLAGGETSYTTAHLASEIDDRYVHIHKLQGKEGARLAAGSHSAAIDTIERIVNEESIDCDFRRVDGYLFAPPGDPLDLLYEELFAAQDAGLAGVMRADRAPLASFETGSCLRFSNQGQFHPLAYAAGLAGAIERRGGRIFTHSRVTKIEPAGALIMVVTESGAVVAARRLVIATGAPIRGPKEIDAKQAAYQTYVVTGLVAAGSVVPALYWDTADPYHYVRTAPHPTDPGRLYLIVGGEDRKTGTERDATPRFGELEEWTCERFPMVEKFVCRWSGEVMETIDGLAFIGKVPNEERIYTITGDSGMGMTHGTIGGLLVSDLIMGRRNEWSRLYDPSRKRGIATRDFFAETFDMVKQYARHFAPADTKAIGDIAPGSGAIVQEGRDKIAVYRDEHGDLHRLSSSCTHLGCMVAWNATEKTWDCPCHGSRFDTMGSVIHGPAVEALQRIEARKSNKVAR
jgi:glycine/D-amino acid oxidase-like deaminating enzyme/nitrite reductase/ring-hydroxylating ferredoxin subunit